jgi:hypothetical protein
MMTEQSTLPLDAVARACGWTRIDDFALDATYAWPGSFHGKQHYIHDDFSPTVAMFGHVIRDDFRTDSTSMYVATAGNRHGCDKHQIHEIEMELTDLTHIRPQLDLVARQASDLSIHELIECLHMGPCGAQQAGSRLRWPDRLA